MDPAIVELLAGYPVSIPLTVQWGEQDPFQHVNHAVYFRWFESARLAYWGETGLSALMKRERVGPILASITCDYRRQLTYPDTVHVGVRVNRIGRTSMEMGSVVVSDAGRVLAAESRATIVVFDYNAGTPVPVPDEIRRAMEKTEGRPL